MVKTEEQKAQELLESEVTFSRLLIKVGSRTNRDTGEKFPTFKSLTKSGNLVIVHFNRTVSEVPQTNCTIVLRNDEDFNLVKKGKYLHAWVNHIYDTEAIFQENKFVEGAKKNNIKTEGLF